MGDYINPNIDLLGNAVRSYEKNKIRIEKAGYTINVNQNIQNNTYETTVNNIFETIVNNNNTFVSNTFTSIAYEDKKTETETASYEDNKKYNSNDTDKHSIFEDLTEKITTIENLNTEFENTLPIDESQFEGLIHDDFIDILKGNSRKERESVFFNIIETLPKGLITLQKEKYCWNGKVLDPNLAKTKIGMYIYPFFHKCYENGLINFDKLPLTETNQKVFVAEIIRKTFSIPHDIRISPAQFSKIKLKNLKREFGHYLSPFEKIPHFSEKLFLRT